MKVKSLQEKRMMNEMEELKRQMGANGLEVVEDESYMK